MSFAGLALALEGIRDQAGVRAVDEQALIRAAQGGNRTAFEELVRQYDQDVLRLAMKLIYRVEDVYDVYQEVFLKVFKNLHRFRFECSFYTWLYRIVTNVCLDHMRRRATRREDQPPETGRVDGDGRAADFFERQTTNHPAADPARQLLGKETGRRINEALAELPRRERMVFELKHYHGLKLRVIGEMLGTSEETVKNSLFRATRKLRVGLRDLV